MNNGMKPNGEEDDGRFKNRSGLEIIASIISASLGGARKTHIMYKANLSHSQLQRYLNYLETYGLIRVIKERSGKASVYEITEKGMDFLRDYERLEGYLKQKESHTNPITNTAMSTQSE